jgi:Leucine-rich repeat (LRR) protein
MPFDVEYYLTEFPDNTTFIDLSNKHLKILPDLSRFTNLQRLDCKFNRFTHLNNLPKTLTILNCSHNGSQYIKKFINFVLIRISQNMIFVLYFYVQQNNY